MSVADDPTTDRPRQQGWGQSFLWLAVSGLVFVVYELTASPGLAAATACVKFGWEEFATAWWLRRRDPVRPRGRASSWLCVASGLWRVAVTGVIVMFAVGFAQVAFAKRGNPNGLLPAFKACLFVALFGFLFSTLATLRAFAGAYLGGLRLWIDPGIHHERRLGRFPPTGGEPYRTNRAGGLLVTALLLALFGAFVVAEVAVLHNLKRARPAWFVKPTGDLIGLGTIMLTLIGVPVTALILRNTVRRSTLARSPDEAWADAPGMVDPYDCYIA